MRRQTRYLKLLNSTSAENQAISINLILSDLISLLKSQPSVKSSKLVVKPLESDLLAAMNCTELIHVMINLCVNAFQSPSRTQTMEVVASRHDQPIDVDLLPNGSGRSQSDR
jgi:C4-dicarboxylate-specific signal transduction histidine kinase